ncbi:MAG: helix-turn-helix transcriptional regulator [Bacteroidales bacterium]|nr:helix-turn-helix transcriptional regulator [Bacteroidales bacterium]
MKVICPACKKEQEYNSKSEVKRKRKKCSFCSYFFEVKLDRTADFINRDKVIQKAKTQEVKKLGDLDNKILQAIISGKRTQVDILKELQKISPFIEISMVSRHLKKLQKLELVREIKSYPKFYDIVLEKPKDPENPEINGVTMHKFQCVTKIISGNFNPELIINQVKMRNWTKLYFKENDLLFQKNGDSSLTYWPTGAGKTPDEAINNAKEKAIKIKEFIENKFSCKLSFPSFKNEDGNQKVHFVPITTNQKTLGELQEVWTDETHDGSIESDGKEFVNQVVNLNKDVQDLKAKTNGELEAKIQSIVKTEIENQLTQFQISITREISSAVGTSVSNALKSLFFNNQNPGPSGGPNTMVI